MKRHNTLCHGLTTLLYCALWALLSSGLILLNNHLMREENFSYPIIICGLGQAVSGLAARLLVSGRYMRQEVRFNWGSYVRSIVPIAVASAGSLVPGNACYLYLSVSFIQIMKATTPVVTMIVMFAFGLQHPHRKLILSVMLISAACALASWGELEMNAIGLFLIVFSNLCEALKTVATEKLLQARFSNPMEGLYHVCPPTVVALLFCASFEEIPRLIAEGGQEKILTKPHLYLAAGCMGLAVNWLTMEVIKRINSLTFKVMGQAKNVAVVVAGVVFLNNQVTPVQTFAYGLSIAGFFMYNSAVSERATPPVLPAYTSDAVFDVRNRNMGLPERDYLNEPLYSPPPEYEVATRMNETKDGKVMNV